MIYPKGEAMAYSSLEESMENKNIAVEVRLKINTPQGSKKVFLFVEGQDDLSLYRRILKNDYLEIKRSQGGKSEVIKIIKDLADHYSQVLGFIDADFDNILKNRTYANNVFLTDCHDLEMMMVKCDEVYNEAILDFVDNVGCCFKRDKAFTLIEFVSCLKYVKYAKFLDLNLNPPFRHYIDLVNNNFKKQEYLDQIYAVSGNRDYTMPVADIIANAKIVNDPYNLTNGHDFMIIIAELINYINKKTGLYSGNKDREIERTFRGFYTLQHFKKSQLYLKFVLWLSTHSHSEILSEFT